VLARWLARVWLSVSELATEQNPAVSDSADWVFARVPRRRRDVVLDVAAGTGGAGRSLAGEVHQVIALDTDPTRLQTARAEALGAGVENVLYMSGDAGSLPFLDASFRLVLCGFAVHGFSDPRVELAEIRRVLQPRGWLGLADLVVSEDAAVAERQNRIERRRDPAHTRALSASELQDTVARLGYEVVGAETHELRRPVDAWLELAGTPEAPASEIRAELSAEADGGSATGLAPRVEADGSLSVLHTLTSLLVLNRDV
jgi:SAM-dependent methyltransferase